MPTLLLSAAKHASPGLSASDALPLLLTTESLLFAALGVSVALTAPAPGGRAPFVATGRLAGCIAFTLTLVAVGGAAAWLTVFTSPDAHGWGPWLRAGGIAAGIVLQPLFAWLIFFGVRRPSGG